MGNRVQCAPFYKEAPAKGHESRSDCPERDPLIGTDVLGSRGDARSTHRPGSLHFEQTFASVRGKTQFKPGAIFERVFIEQISACRIKAHDPRVTAIAAHPLNRFFKCADG